MEHLATVSSERTDGAPKLRLFLASFAALYFELLIIRYLGTEIRVFAYLKNFPLIACFLGIGLGMIYGTLSKTLERVFLIILPVMLAGITFAAALRLDEVGFPQIDYKVFGSVGYQGIGALSQLLIFIGVSLAVLAALICIFTAFGCIVGEWFKVLKPLPAYSVNLTGSLAGLAAFTLLSYLRMPPAVWLVIGLAILAPWLWKRKIGLALMIIVTAASAVPQPQVIWSPYYRIDLMPAPLLPRRTQPSAYFLTVNHHMHQRILDLSADFLGSHRDSEPNSSARFNYELPYELIGRPNNVLIVGAGTGNDVAAALRHGASSIDAVEIDPAIADIGRRYHPEHPYQSPRVTVYINDARAFLKNTKRKYDLILFAYLDSHTMLTAFSSLRLDNYVYTLDSFREAKRSLESGGALMVAFNSGRQFVDNRIFATMADAFGKEPRVFETYYDGQGRLYVEGVTKSTTHQDIAPQLRAEHVIVPTDNWPFLYLYSRRIPFGFMVMLILFLTGMSILVKKTVPGAILKSSANLHFLLLGCGFLLLETGAVTRLSLLFGSTWITNAIVIAAFLFMAILGNVIVMMRPLRLSVAYAGLFVTLVSGMLFPYSSLEALSLVQRAAVSGLLIGLPVLFSGMVFSFCLKDADRTSEVLGVNLLGAMAGGALENVVMIGGTTLLWQLAILVYGCAAGALLFSKRFAHVQSARAIPVLPLS